MGFYSRYVDEISGALGAVEVTADGEHIDPEHGMQIWCELTARLNTAGQTMYFIGNGASASMASHMSADACKNGELRCSCFNEISLLTAIANDVSYEQAFAVPLRRFGRDGDILVAISSSGNSPNIINAIEAAREIGVYVVTLSGMGADNRARSRGHLNFYVPAQEYGHVESSHQVILHAWLDQYLLEREEPRGRWE